MARRSTEILICLVAVITVISSIASAATLEEFVITPISQQLSSYGSNIAAASNFPLSPNVTQVAIPIGAVKTVYGSNTTVSGNSFTAYVSAEGPSGGVLAGDWSERFTFDAPLTGVVAASDNFTLYSAFTSTLGTSYGPLNYTFSITFTAANLLFTTVTIFVDYGAITPPLSVTTLIFTIQQT